MKTTSLYIRLALLLVTVGGIGALSSCKKFLQIDLPKDQLTSDAVFSNGSDALSAVNGLYTYALEEPNDYSLTPADFLTYQGDFLLGITSDEFTYGQDYYDEFMNNTISPDNYNIENIWEIFYQLIYQSNSIIEKIPGTPIADSLKARYSAEAKVFRALAHLYLTAYFGDVPLIQTTNVTVTSTAARTARATVLAAVVADLKDAAAVLPESSVKNGRFTKWMATGLLARAYLYQGDWANAEAAASVLINNTTDFGLESDLNKVFLRGSREAIWQVNSTGGTFDNYTLFGAENVPTAYSSLGYITQVRPELANAFEAGDLRKAAWIGTDTISGTGFYYDYKYKQTGTPTSSADIEDYTLIRLAEQYLIRAEARARQNDLAGAIDDLNMIRERAGLADLGSGLSQSDLMLAILQERRVELFGEGYGHRWLDLIRMRYVNDVMQAEKPATWNPKDTLFPIPSSEIQRNPALTPNP